MKIIKSFMVIFCIAILSSCTPQKQEEPITKEMEETTMNNENAVIENIMARRSIRKYKAQPVERAIMNQILECGINAPNGRNLQSWEIRVIDDAQLMEEMKEKMAQAHPEMNPDEVKGCFRGAPTMVFIARDTTYDFSEYDCGLLAENMMLSAWSLGVGSICLGSPIRFLKDNELCQSQIEMLDFSENYDLCLCVGFGYADETPDAKPRDKSKFKYIDR